MVCTCTPAAWPHAVVWTCLNVAGGGYGAWPTPPWRGLGPLKTEPWHLATDEAAVVVPNHVNAFTSSGRHSKSSKHVSVMPSCVHTPPVEEFGPSGRLFICWFILRIIHRGLPCLCPSCSFSASSSCRRLCLPSVPPRPEDR